MDYSAGTGFWDHNNQAAGKWWGVFSSVETVLHESIELAWPSKLFCSGPTASPTAEGSRSQIRICT